MRIEICLDFFFFFECHRSSCQLVNPKGPVLHWLVLKCWSHGSDVSATCWSLGINDNGMPQILILHDSCITFNGNVLLIQFKKKGPYI